MRTLVLGIPVPHYTFDNYTFLSSPSLPDYPRAIADIGSISQVVEQVVSGSEEHVTFGGQPIINAPSTPDFFGLSEILAMRRREAERLLNNGGSIVLFAQPDFLHSRINGTPDWRRFSWLPCPPGFEYQRHIVPGFGKAAPAPALPGHPFAFYVEKFGEQLSYRAYVDESAPDFENYGRVFATSPGGLPIGVELTVSGGRIILLPLPARIDNRGEFGETLFDCLNQLESGPGPESPELSREEVS